MRQEGLPRAAGGGVAALVVLLCLHGRGEVEGRAGDGAEVHGEGRAGHTLPPPAGLRFLPVFVLGVTLYPKSKDRSAAVYLRPPLPLAFRPLVFFAIDRSSSCAAHQQLYQQNSFRQNLSGQSWRCAASASVSAATYGLAGCFCVLVSVHGPRVTAVAARQ